MLHNKLIQSFPSSMQESVKIEVGVIVDLVTHKPTETHTYTLDKNQYVALVEEIIDRMNHAPKIKVIYPFGSPCIIDINKTMVYEKNYIKIEFL